MLLCMSIVLFTYKNEDQRKNERARVVKTLYSYILDALFMMVRCGGKSNSKLTDDEYRCAPYMDKSKLHVVYMYHLADGGV